MNTPTTETIYEQLGISKEVWAFGQKTEEKLKERFEEFDNRNGILNLSHEAGTDEKDHTLIQLPCRRTA